MRSKRFRVSMQRFLVLTVIVAALSTLVFAFGNHCLYISTHAVAQRHPAFLRIDNSGITGDAAWSRCTFNGVSFDLPTSMVDTARIVRNSAEDVWLAFGDSNERLQLPLISKDMKSSMASLPFELRGLTVPKLLELSVTADSDDFSMAMSKRELRVHDWAMASRDLLKFEQQNFDRYSPIHVDQAEAILISANPALIDSPSRLHSIFVWESTDHRSFGSMWFGVAPNADASWIDSVANSFACVPGECLMPAELKQMSDAELLSRVSISAGQTK